MNKIDLYEEVILTQMRDARDTMEEGAVARDELSSDGSSSRILDVGCGPGAVTHHVVARHLPGHATIVGSDISPKMVDYANAKYGNERIKFKVLDIAHPQLEKVWTEEPFHKIFSFYCLHWVRDQRSTAANMYKLLNPGGEILLLFLAQHPAFALYEELAKTAKWKTYLGDVQRFISPYHKSEDPSKEFARILEGAGFVNVSVHLKESSFEYPSFPFLMKLLESVNPFWDSVPEELHAEFLDDIRNLFVDKDMVYVDPVRLTARIEYSLIKAKATRA